MAPNDEHIRAAILGLLQQRAAGGTACPSEVARSLRQDGWRDLLPAVRAAARRLAEAGAIEVTQRGQPLPADGSWRGPIRLRLLAV